MSRPRGPALPGMALGPCVLPPVPGPRGPRPKGKGTKPPVERSRKLVLRKRWPDNDHFISDLEKVIACKTVHQRKMKEDDYENEQMWGDLGENLDYYVPPPMHDMDEWKTSHPGPPPESTTTSTATITLGQPDT